METWAKYALGIAAGLGVYYLWTKQSSPALAASAQAPGAPVPSGPPMGKVGFVLGTKANADPASYAYAVSFFVVDSEGNQKKLISDVGRVNLPVDSPLVVFVPDGGNPPPELAYANSMQANANQAVLLTQAVALYLQSHPTALRLD